MYRETIFAEIVFFMNYDPWPDHGNAFLSCKSHKATCIPHSRTSSTMSSNITLNQVKRDLLCDTFASMRASEETLPIMKNVSREDPCN